MPAGHRGRVRRPGHRLGAARRRRGRRRHLRGVDRAARRDCRAPPHATRVDAYVRLHPVVGRGVPARSPRVGDVPAARPRHVQRRRPRAQGVGPDGRLLQRRQRPVRGRARPGGAGRLHARGHPPRRHHRRSDDDPLRRRTEVRLRRVVVGQAGTPDRRCCTDGRVARARQLLHQAGRAQGLGPHRLGVRRRKPAGEDPPRPAREGDLHLRAHPARTHRAGPRDRRSRSRPRARRGPLVGREHQRQQPDLYHLGLAAPRAALRHPRRPGRLAGDAHDV